MTFKFSLKSLDNLKGVSEDLVKVCYRTLLLSPYDFAIIEGVRSGPRQHELFLSGKSQLDWPSPEGQRDGPHLTGKAVDFMAYVNDQGTFDIGYYREIADAFKQAGKELKIEIYWGGDNPHFKDEDHIELVAVQLTLIA